MIQVRHYIFRILFVLVLLVLTCMSFAAADQVAIVTISDDLLVSCTDEEGATLRQVVEAYTYALEKKNDSIYVFGSTHGNGMVSVHTPESQSFDWESGDIGRNSDYFRKTLSQLQNADVTFNRVIILTGQIKNAQNPNRSVVNEDIPVILYGVQPMPQNDSLAKYYNQGMTLSFASDERGYSHYGNVLVKENTRFSAKTMLEDLLCQDFSGIIAPQENGELLLPEVLSSESVLFITGYDLKDVNLILNGEEIYTVTSDEKEKTENTWYSPLFKFGSKDMYVIPIPEGVAGSLKISGAEDVRTSLYYIKAQGFDEKLQQIEYCSNSLQYTADEMVSIMLTEDKYIRELKLLYPEMSFQAKITPVDASEPVTVYADDKYLIHWKDEKQVDAKVVVSLLDSKDGNDILPPREFKHTALLSYLKDLKPVTTIQPEDQHKKREETLFTLSFSLEDFPEEARERILNWLAGASVVLSSPNKDVQEGMSYEAESCSFSATTCMPGTEGAYTWKAEITSELQESMDWKKSWPFKEIAIENMAPICNENLIDKKEISISVQPGSTAPVVIPRGIFTDADGDPLDIFYTITKYSDIITGSYQTIDGISPEYTINEINDFGEWTIKLYAEDNDHETSETITLLVHVEDGNTAPYIDEKRRPREEEKVPVLKLSDHPIIIPRGLFVDDERETMSIQGSLTYEDGNYVSFSFAGTDGKSDMYKVEFAQFGVCTIQLQAADPHGKTSEPIEFKVNLIDALSALPGKLTIDPERPKKGETVKIVLKIDWPDEYRSLEEGVRRWLENSQAVLSDDNGNSYKMKLLNSDLWFESENIKMPETKADIEYGVVIISNDGNLPQKKFLNYEKLSVSIDNSAPEINPEVKQNNLPGFLFDLNDYKITIPEKLFTDKDGDRIEVKVDYIDENGEIKGTETYDNEESRELTLHDFGTWTIRLTATDTEMQSSEPFDYYTGSVHNLKVIVIIASVSLVALMALLVTVLVIRYKKNLPRFHQKDYIQFVEDNQEASEHIQMLEGDARQAIPLTTFAAAISVLLTDTQWNNLRQWNICPTKEDKPIFKRMGAKIGGEDEIDLGDGLKVMIGSQNRRNYSNDKAGPVHSRT